MRTHNHGIDQLCEELETPEGLKGACMFVAEPPSKVKGLATEEDLKTLQGFIGKSKTPWVCGNSLVEGGFTGEYRSPAKSEFHAKVRKELNAVEELLVEKNEAYGNSALDPINVFSKASSIEQLKVRIDDKLNRLYHGKEYGQEDTVTDLTGYLILLLIARKEEGSGCGVESG